MTQGRKSPRNFQSYGTIEAVNVMLVPAMAIYLAPPRNFLDAAVLAAAILPTCGLLIVGAIYWLALARRLRGDRSLFLRWLPIADAAQRPLLALVFLAVVASGAAFLLRGFTGPVIAALVLTSLAALEYVNYYHRQLQHFDNWSDFKKLVTTGRLRPARSARDLAAYRTSTVRRSRASTSVGERGPN